MNQSIKSHSFKIGIIGAILSICIYTYMWYAKDYNNLVLTVIRYLFPIIIGISAQIVTKVKLNATLFKQFILAYFICIVLIFAAECLTNYIIYNWIDPQAKEILLKAWRDIYANSSNKLAANQVLKEPTYNLSAYAIEFTSKTLMYLVPGLISGLVLSKAPKINT